MTIADATQVYARAIHGSPPSMEKEWGMEPHEVRPNWDEVVDALGILLEAYHKPIPLELTMTIHQLGKE